MDRSEVLRQHLDRHIPVELRIPSPIHLAHAARTERFEDFVMTEGFADHGGAFFRGSAPSDYVQWAVAINRDAPTA